MMRHLALIAALLALFAVQISGASYTVTHVTTQVTLNVNTSASVRETYTVVITNASISQYQSARSALNLTLSNWQDIIGPTLTQHIINPKTGVYGFELFPGPITTSITGQQEADVLISYGVRNVTSVDEIAPRVFQHTFNDDVFNFAHGVSGEVLPANYTLTIVLPNDAGIKSIYPLPDSPPNLLANNFMNVTMMSWFSQEPLSKFLLVYTTHQTIEGEVSSFFTAAYNFFGFFTYVIIILIVLFFILYTYLKIEK